MNITVTGASGFVGRNLCKYLEDEGQKVSPLSLREVWSLDPRAEVIIHLAGKAHDTSNAADSRIYYKVNRDLTIDVFNAFLQSSCKDFIYFSSVKAAADTVNDKLDENFLPNPQTAYGKSKLEAEKYLLAQILPSDKRLFIIRPCMIHGPGNKGNLNLLYRVVKNGLPWPLAAFKNERSFLSIDNLNFLILKILEDKSVLSGIYNFSDDEAVSTNELVKIIAKAAGKKEKLWKINPRIIAAVAKYGDLLKLILNSERLKKLTESYVVDNSKIKRSLHISTLPLSASKGLEKTIESF